MQCKCSPYHLSEIFLQANLNEIDKALVNKLFDVVHKVHRGEKLFTSGDNFKSIFTVRSGFFKSSFLSSDGFEQITGFHMTGEMLGLDGIATNHHTCIAVALEDSSVYEIKFSKLLELTLQIKGLQHNINKILSSEIIRHQNEIMILGRMHTEERLAVFLMDLSARLHARGYSKHELILKMKREDIAGFLGMKNETLSRALSKMMHEGIIDVDRNSIKIVNMELLHSAGKKNMKSEFLNSMSKREMCLV